MNLNAKYMSTLLDTNINLVTFAKLEPARFLILLKQSEYRKEVKPKMT
jgi:hypothetical protein